MNTYCIVIKKHNCGVLALTIISALVFCSSLSAQADSTVNEPLILKREPKPKNANTNIGPLGSATVKESRRENGQVYKIELKHSAGAKQTIEKNDSDGSIKSKGKGIDDTPNLAKWTLGSW